MPAVTARTRGRSLVFAGSLAASQAERSPERRAGHEQQDGGRGGHGQPAEPWTATGCGLTTCGTAGGRRHPRGPPGPTAGDDRWPARWRGGGTGRRSGSGAVGGRIRPGRGGRVSRASRSARPSQRQASSPVAGRESTAPRMASRAAGRIARSSGAAVARPRDTTDHVRHSRGAGGASPDVLADRGRLGRRIGDQGQQATRARRPPSRSAPWPQRGPSVASDDDAWLAVSDGSAMSCGPRLAARFDRSRSSARRVLVLTVPSGQPRRSAISGWVRSP